MKDLYDESPSSRQPITIDSGAPNTRSESNRPSAEESGAHPAPEAHVGALRRIAVTPMGACAVIGSNCMLDTFTWTTFGLGFFFQILVAAAVGYFVLETQRHAGDPESLARPKAFLLFALTALPVPLSIFLVGPAGIAGLVAKWRSHH